ncbi:MAG: glutamate mutase L [Bacillota bacterium]
MKQSRFLIIDVGSTTTKALLIEPVGEEYRLTYRGEAATTVEAPDEDVMIGVERAVREIARLSGRCLWSEAGVNLGEEGVDDFLATSSAGGGLQVMVCGLSRTVTAESAQRAALGAGAVLLDVISADDGRNTFMRTEAMRRARPDMVLLAGGIDGGQKVDFALELCDLLNAASPPPRFGKSYTLPVIYAGNNRGAPLVEDTLEKQFELHVVPNLRPAFDKENLGPARAKIHELFLNHVMAQAPGYAQLLEQATAPILPTPVAVGKIMTELAARDQLDILGVDIGGATTDVFTVIDNEFNRTVSANLGMSYSAGNVLLSADIEQVQRWLPFALDGEQLANEILHKMINPTTVPATIRDLLIEQALAREALRLALEQHNQLVISLPRERTVLERALSSQQSNLSTLLSRSDLVNMQGIGLLVGSGGVLSHAPRRAQAAAMLLDAFQPQGETFLAVDSIFMMPHLGVLSERHPEIALEVLKKDCFVPLGPSFRFCGTVRSNAVGRPGLRYELRAGSERWQGELAIGEIVVLPLGSEQQGALRLQPSGTLDVGAGPGRALEKQVFGGEVGVILDARPAPPAAGDWRAQARALLALGAFTEEELRRSADV